MKRSKSIAFMTAQALLASSILLMPLGIAEGAAKSPSSPKTLAKTPIIKNRVKAGSESIALRPKAKEETQEAFSFLGVSSAGLKTPDLPAVAAPSTPISTQLAARKAPAKSTWSSGSNANNAMTLRTGVSAASSALDLTVGKATVLDLPRAAARISISDPNVATAVVLSPTQIQLIGLAPGTTNLLFWDNLDAKKYRSLDLIVQRDVSVLKRQLQQLDPNLTVIPMAADDTVILTGEVETREKAQLAVELAKAFFKSSTSSGGGAAAGGAAGGGGGKGNTTPSQTPGSYTIGASQNIMNLIHVKGEPTTKLEMVQRKLQEIDPNIQLDIVPGPDGSEKAILTGKVQMAGTVAKALNLTAIFYGTPGIKVITGPGGRAVRPTGEGTLEFFDGTKFNGNLDLNLLQGSVVTDSTGNVVSMMEVVNKPQIRCQVKFMEISRADLDQLGHTFQGSFGPGFQFGSLSGNKATLSGRNISDINPDESGAGFTTSQGTGFARSFSRAAGAAGANALDITRNRSTNSVSALTQTFRDGLTQVFAIDQRFIGAISALEDKRKVRSLAEPTMMLLSGENGSFLAGGEIPVPTLGANGSVNVEYHEFGIRLNLIPTVTDDGKIHMQVAPEVSSVDNANSISTSAVTVPGFRTRRLHSTMEVMNGQSLVLAGLYTEDDTSIVSRFPGLGTLPIIGSFFRSKFRDKRDTELVIIIKPEIITTDGSGAGPMYPRVSQKPVSGSEEQMALENGQR